MAVETQKLKTGVLIWNAAIVDNDDPVGAFGDANPVSLDTLGWDYVDIVVMLGETDIALSALGVYSGPAPASGADDATYAAITGLQASGTTGDGRLPTATDDNKLFHFGIDLRNDDIDRYLAVDCTVGDGSTGAYVTVFYILSRAEEAPSTASGRGFAWSLAV